MRPTQLRNRRQVLANMVLYNRAMISVILALGSVSALRGRSLTPLSQTTIGSNYKDLSAELGESVALRPELLWLLLKLCLRLVSIVGKCAVLLEHIMTVSSNALHHHCVHSMDVSISIDPQTDLKEE